MVTKKNILYTYEQVIDILTSGSFPYNSDEIDEILSEYIPIELPSEEEIDAIANDIGHNYFVMQRNHYEGLIEGSRRMAYWFMKRFKQED
jgi:hypothetical protein